MSNKTVMSFGAVGLVGILALGVLATHVGGVALRNNIDRGKNLSLSVNEPLMRGVPTRVQWEAEDDSVNGWLQLFVRDRQGETVIGSSAFESSEAMVVIPCGASDNLNSLIVKELDSGRVVGFKSVKVLPAGRECSGL